MIIYYNHQVINGNTNNRKDFRATISNNLIKTDSEYPLINPILKSKQPVYFYENPNEYNGLFNNFYDRNQSKFACNKSCKNECFNGPFKCFEC